ncbi:MAG: putative zinc-binding metallopeptidase [Ferruginibacter sp.]
MKSLKYIILTTCLLAVLASCKKDEVLNDVVPVGLGGDTTTPTAIDKWITDSLTTPYNIAAKYRWDPFNVSLFKTLTPADESRVIPLFSALKKVWINPYNAETGSELFIKKYSPKQFVLVGSVEYDFYSVTLGQAEGGNSIVFFDVNQNFDQNPITSIKRVIHTAHHEFGHILHQTIMYPQDFKGISTKLGLPGYTATWFNVADADALEQGYATAYSRASPDEDFVEMIATMLTEGKTKWEEMKAGVNATARQALQQKEDIVVTYYRQVWNIDFYSLQARVQAALNALYPPPPVSDLYGFGQPYTSGQVGELTAFYAFPPFVQFPASPAFTTLYNGVKAKFATENPSLTLRSFEVYFNSATTMQLYMYYNPNNATANAAMPSTFAVYTYNSSQDASGTYTFTITSANANGIARQASANPLLAFFNNNKFDVEWFESPNVTTYPKIKFVPVANPDSWFTAGLAP